MSNKIGFYEWLLYLRCSRKGSFDTIGFNQTLFDDVIKAKKHENKSVYFRGENENGVNKIKESKKGVASMANYKNA